MKNKVFILVLLKSSFLIAQVQQIVQNGSFENGSGYPTGQGQLTYLTPACVSNLNDPCDQFLNCSNWVYPDYPGKGQASPDWYRNPGPLDALTGGCPVEGNSDAMAIINAQPKILAKDGDFYAGCGSGESMVNHLSDHTCKDGRVKVSFWFCLRGTKGVTQPLSIGVNLRENKNNSIKSLFNLSQFEIFKDENTPDFPACTWFYYESPWIQLDCNEYNELMIGGGNNNIGGGDFYSVGYVYYDDVKLLSGCAACIDHMQYENTSSLPTLTHTDNYVRAGYDAGIPNTSGNVTVTSSQNVTFKAGNQIILEPGFSTQSGAMFQAIIEDCNPATHPSPEPIYVEFIPNVFSPNGDGINDEFCFKVYGANYYEFHAFLDDGTPVFNGSGIIENNFICVWNGDCNVQPTCTMSTVCNGAYAFVLDLYPFSNNCNDHKTSFANTVNIVGASCRIMNHPIDTTITTEKNNSMVYISPNPSTGLFTLRMEENLQSEVIIYNSLAQIVYKSQFSNSQTVIDLSSQPKGVYFIRVQNVKNILTDKIIIQ